MEHLKIEKIKIHKMFQRLVPYKNQKTKSQGTLKKNKYNYTK
jgi:hypothetical protein